MKNRTLIIMCIVPCILMSTKNFCSSLTLFMKPYPEINQEETANKLQKKATRLDHLAHYLMPGTSDESVVSGIFSSYAGFLAASDNGGQTTFPENYFSADRPKGYILVTRRINPILTFGLTVFRLEREPNLPAALYSVELKRDEDLKEFYWQVKAEPLTDKLKISMKSIIIFANPDKIYLPEGITPAKAVANTVLPDIYVKKNLSKVHDALYVLTIRQFFSPAKKEFKHEPLRNIIQLERS